MSTLDHMRKVVPAQRFPRHNEVVARAAELRQAGLGYVAIANQLNEERWPTARGGKWGASTVRSLLLSHAPEVAAAAYQREATSTYADFMARSIDEAIATGTVPGEAAPIPADLRATLIDEFDKAMAERSAHPNATGYTGRSADE